MHRTPRSLVLAATASALVALAAACSSSSTNAKGQTSPTTGTGSTQAAATGGGSTAKQLTIGLANAPSTLDPYGFVAPPQTYFFHVVYDGLTAMDPTGKVVPGLATSWQLSGSTQWTLQLRPSVQFTNGETLTASGVKADLDYLMGHPSEPDAVEVSSIASVDASGPTTIVITTKAPDPILMQQLTAVPIPAPQAFNANPSSFATTAIGTGPYKLASFTSGQNLQLTANPTSWHGAPSIPTVKFVSIPADATRVAALKSGQIDIAQSVGPDDIPSLKSAGFQVEEVPRGQIQQVMFEVASHPNSPIANQQVRLALNYAVDTNTIIKTVLGGTSAPAHGQVVNSDAVGFNPNVNSYPYDPQKAKQLLTAAGYPNGFSATLETTTGAFPNDQQAYDAVASYLKAVGIKLTVQNVPLPQFVKALRAGPRAEMFIAGLQYIPELDTSKAMFWWLCSQPTAAKRFCDPTLDSLMAKANSTMDATARAQVLQQANARWHEDALSIPLWQLTDIWALRKGITGWVKNPDAYLDLSSLQANAT